MVIKVMTRANVHSSKSFYSVSPSFWFHDHIIVTVAQVHPTLLENNGYNTSPIKTAFWCKTSALMTVGEPGLSNTEKKRFSCARASSERVMASVMDGTAWLKLRPFWETHWQMHTKTHRTWIVKNGRLVVGGALAILISAAGSPSNRTTKSVSVYFCVFIPPWKKLVTADIINTFQYFASVFFECSQCENGQNFWQMSIAIYSLDSRRVQFLTEVLCASSRLTCTKKALKGS